jgi:hypothetical protein
MKIKVLRKGIPNAKPVAYCDFLVDDPPPMAKMN